MTDFILINEQLPIPNALCEVCYEKIPSRLVRFISVNGFNGDPLWVDEEGKTVVTPIMTAWRYVLSGQARDNEIESWLSTLPSVED